MKLLAATVLTLSAALVVSCNERRIDAPELSESSSFGSGASKHPSFDAYILWDTGQGLKPGSKGVFDYPQDYRGAVPSFNSYNRKFTEPKADGLFFVESNDVDEMMKKGPTTGALVTDVVVSKNVSTGVVIHPELITSGLLVYPAKNGRAELKLKFVIPQNLDNLYMKHTHAEDLCRKLKLRLPTARELFDYCNAGYPYSDPWKRRDDKREHRCGLSVWSASTIAKASTFAFISSGGLLGREYRSNVATTMCVGHP